MIDLHDYILGRIFSVLASIGMIVLLYFMAVNYTLSAIAVYWLPALIASVAAGLMFLLNLAYPMSHEREALGRRAYFTAGALAGLAVWILATGSYQTYLTTGHWNAIGGFFSALICGSLAALVARSSAANVA